MSKKIYIGQSGLSKEVTNIYVGINDHSRKIRKAYIGIDGSSRQIYPNTVIHRWNRFNVDTTYTWDRYNINTTYVWNQYGIETAYQNRLVQVGTFGRYQLTHDYWYGGQYYQRLYVYYTTGYSINTSNGMITLTGGNKTGFEQNGPTNIVFFGSTAKNVYYVEGTTSASQEGRQSMEIRFAYTLTNGAWTNDGGIIYRAATTQTVGNYIGQVTSGNRFAYPDNAIFGNNWYIYQREDKSRGSLNGSVSSVTTGSYPSNGISGSYWYVSTGYKQSQGSQNGSVTSENINAFPNNGIHSDGYWYVYAGIIS